MLEYCIYIENKEIHNKEMLIDKYKDRSILDQNVKVLDIFDRKGCILYSDKYDYQGEYIYKFQDKFVLLTGYIVSKDFHNYNRENIAECIFSLLNKKRVEWVDEALGEFQIIYYDGEKIEIYYNKSMTHPIYYREDGIKYVISNRASLCNLDLNNYTPTIDPISQLEIVAFDSILRNRTAFKEVKCLERGYSIKLQKCSYKVEFKLIKFKEFWSEGYVNLSLKEAMERGREINRWLVENLDLMDKQLKIDSGMEFHLSGGKDSRSLISVFQNAGLMRYFNNVLTFGEDNDPEVIAAKNITQRLNLYHINKERGINRAVLFDRLPHHIYQLEGEINCRVLQGNYETKRKTHFTGHELGLREAYANTGSIKDYKDAKKFIEKHLPMDPIGILSQKFHKLARNEMYNIAEKAQEFNIMASNFPNYYAIVGRGARWVGKLTSMSEANGLYSNVLCSTKIVKYAHNIGVKNRGAEAFHFSSLLETNSNLLKFPFANQDWAKEIKVIYGNKYSLPENPICSKSTSQKQIKQWWDVLYQRQNKQYIKKIIDALRHKELEQYIDYNLLYYYIDAANNPSMRAMLSIYALISSNLLLHSGDITKSTICDMKKTLSEVEKYADGDSKMFMMKESKNVLFLPLKNQIYKNFFSDNPKGSDRVNLRLNRNAKGENNQILFIHSGNKTEILLEEKICYCIKFRCIVLKNIIDKCEEQIFKINTIISDELKNVFIYRSKKGERDILEDIVFEIKVKDKIVFEIDSDDSTAYGWCGFEIISVQEIIEESL